MGIDDSGDPVLRMPFLATGGVGLGPVSAQVRRHAGRQAVPEAGAVALRDAAGHLYSHSESVSFRHELCGQHCS